MLKEKRAIKKWKTDQLLSCFEQRKPTLTVFSFINKRVLTVLPTIVDKETNS